MRYRSSLSRNATSVRLRSVISFCNWMFNESATSVSSCWRTRPSTNASFIASIFSLNCAFSGIVGLPLFLRFRFRPGFVPLRRMRTGPRRDPRDQSFVVRRPRPDDDHALVGDDVFADVLAVIAAAHLDDDHDFAKLAVDLDIAQPDDVIGQERDRIVAEGKSGERVFDFDRAENGDPGSGQRHDHSVERLTKVLAEAG